MIHVNVGQAIETIKRTADDLSEANFRRAVVRSLNETILLGRTEARKKVKAIYNIPQKNLAGINVWKAQGVSMVAKLYASASPIPLDAFGAIYRNFGKVVSVTKKGKQKVKGTRDKSRGAGVSVEIIKGKRITITPAFMIAGGKPRVFGRGQYEGGLQGGFTWRRHRVASGGNDLPVKPLIAISVHAAVINKIALKEIEGKVKEVFPVVLARNVAFLVKTPGT